MYAKAFVLLAVVGVASAYPSFYPSQVDDTVSCDKHPTAAHGAHKAPVVDEALQISLAAGGEDVEAFCPGATYDVKIAYDLAILGMVTLDAGEFADASPQCASRVDLNRQGRDSHSVSWKAPCDGSSVNVKVTAATSPVGAYLTKSSSFSASTKSDCEELCG